jgi:ATPase subunit of ABC transporter with duplicated ATPase domains
VQTVANRVIELTPNGIIDFRGNYDDYLADKSLVKQREKLYGSLVATK